MTDVLQVAAAVLAKASALDPTMPSPNALTVQAWAEQLAGVQLQEAVDAVREHYRASRHRIMPADLLAHVRAARDDAASRAAVPAITAPPDPHTAARHRALVRAIRGLPHDQAHRDADALATHCPWPSCHAAPGSPCTTLGRRRSTPHPSRIDAARKVPAA